jgi:hypothetical protein
VVLQVASATGPANAGTVQISTTPANSARILSATPRTKWAARPPETELSPPPTPTFRILQPTPGRPCALQLAEREATDGQASSGRRLPVDARKMFQIAAAKSEEVLRKMHSSPRETLDHGVRTPA